MKKKILWLIIIVIVAYFPVSSALSNVYLEWYFLKHETDFQKRVDAFLMDEKYTGVKRWLYARGPGEGSRYLPFHMGKNYKKDFYNPRVVYIDSDNPAKASLCSFDGQLITKIKPIGSFVENPVFN